MKIIACYKVLKEIEVEVDNKYTYLEKEWDDFTEEEKISCDEDTEKLHDKVLLVLKKDPDFFSFKSIESKKTGEVIWEN